MYIIYHLPQVFIHTHTHTHTHICVYIFGLPWWPNVKESAWQGRRRGLDPWVGKIPWRRKWQHTPVFLPGKSHGQKNLVGYFHGSTKESDTTWRLNGDNIYIYFLKKELGNCLRSSSGSLSFNHKPSPPAQGFCGTTFTPGTSTLVWWMWAWLSSLCVPRPKHLPCEWNQMWCPTVDFHLCHPHLFVVQQILLPPQPSTH